MFNKPEKNNTELVEEWKKCELNVSVCNAKLQTLTASANKENFLRHYLSRYDEPRLPSCRMMTEMLTWGELSHLYASLQSAAVKKKIAANLGVNAEILESWLKVLNSIRNICAHHGRLWNREMGIAIKIPNSHQIKWLSKLPQSGNVKFERRIYSILTALQTLFYTVSPHSQWVKRLKDLMDKYPDVPYGNMGMPENWYKDDFWREALK